MEKRRESSSDWNQVDPIAKAKEKLKEWRKRCIKLIPDILVSTLFWGGSLIFLISMFGSAAYYMFPRILPRNIFGEGVIWGAVVLVSSSLFLEELVPLTKITGSKAENKTLECPQCHETVLLDKKTIYCPNCYQELKVNCPNCGKLNMKTRIECEHCGEKLPEIRLQEN